MPRHPSQNAEDIGARLGEPSSLIVKLPRFRRVVLELGDYGSVVTASIAAS
jgi:hypothetical protein